MTLFQKKQDKLFNENTLRNKLRKIDNNMRVIIIHNNIIVGIGTPDDLLKRSSNNFMKLLYKPILSEYGGANLYLEV